jgi:beta-catenin-like protein 1
VVVELRRTSFVQVPKLPMGSNKRRMPDMPTPEMLKKMRMETTVGPSSESAAPVPRNGASKPSQSRAAKVEDVDEDEDMDDATAQDFAPGGDADYFVEEDEEGRFFGGGLSKEQKEILNIFDKDVTEGVHEDVSRPLVELRSLFDINIAR